MKNPSSGYGRIPQETVAYINQTTFRTTRNVGLDPHEAEDFKQNLFERVLEQIDNWNQNKGASLASYLHMVVDMMAAEHLRARRTKKRVRVLLVLDAPLGGVDGDDGDDEGCDGQMVDHIADPDGDPRPAIDLRNDVAEILARLQGECLAACRIFMAGGSETDVARELDVSRRHVRRHILPVLRRVFKSLR